MVKHSIAPKIAVADFYQPEWSLAPSLASRATELLCGALHEYGMYYIFSKIPDI
jgi:hypothetical protein